MIESELLSKKYFLEGYTENWSKEIFVTDFVLETNPWTYKIKDLNGEKIIGRFCQRKVLLSKL